MMSVKSNLEASVQIQSLLGALHDLEPVIFFFSLSGIFPGMD